jgi:exodeoxyribonuclease V alpha subunit
VAPTGKAAQRLSESLVNAIAGFSGLITDDVLNHIPTNAQTIHRLLGVIPNSPNFRHHQDNKLAYDVVLIDEVSMVDLPLMTRVFRALKPYCKVILLGDADQLPSVAAGSVLADIAPRPHGGFSEQNISYVSTVCQIDADLLQRGLLPSANQANTGQVNTYQLSAEQSKTIPLINAKLKTNDYLTYLVKSRRFDGKGGIGLLAKAVIEGDGRNSWRLLSEAKGKGSKQLALASSELSVWLPPLIRKYYQPLEKCSHVIDAFALLAKFRVLCATRKGPFGVETINEYIQGYLGKHSFNQSNHKNGQQALYHGQPIMISENNYRLGLYNGDIGIIWRVTDTDGKEHLMACFESTEAEQAGVENTGKICEAQAIRHILPSRLPKFETVYAMTIHKTQGSEFDHVAMLLSAGEGDVNRAKGKVNKLLSRELLYTAITRAKTQLTVGSDQFTWQQGVTGQVIRHSGLTLT